MAKLDRLLADQSLRLLFSQELLDEFVGVAQRPKFKKYFSPSDLDALLGQINSRAQFVLVSSEVTEYRNVKDNFLLALALDGNATHLLTGDKDLLDLSSFRGTAILTIAQYLAGK